MFRQTLLAAAAATVPLPVAAQHHAGMTMPAPSERAAPPRSADRPATRTKSRRPAAPRRATARPPAVDHAVTGHDPAPASAMPSVDHHAMGHATAQPATPPVPPSMGDGAGREHPMAPAGQTQATAMDHVRMGHAPMDHAALDHVPMDHAAMGHAMGFTAPAAYRAASDAALARAPAGAAMPGMVMGAGGGWYAQGSGTARLPAAEGPMRGYMTMAGDWMLMAHGYAWGVATDQGGPRGDDMAFVQSMAMVMADRDLGERVHLQLRGMGSLEPLMGPRGYPNLFATGEVANGRPLVDRQHPHDLFMELAARVDYRLPGNASLFLYGGPVGEPALGPSAFMHRGSARYQPLSPITHHWFDSTHITYGVVTAGYSGPRWQLEASAFKGREPDEHRWNIERPRLDSWSIRGTWTPSPFLAVQASHGFLKTPEELHPDENEHRTTASLHYARGGVATTLAYSLKDRSPGEKLSAWLGEVTWEVAPRHALFGRVENVRNDELFPDEADPLHDQAFRVTKAEAGYAYRLPLVGPLGLALGGTVAAYAKPDALDDAYGSAPVSWTLFTKLAVGL